MRFLPFLIALALSARAAVQVDVGAAVDNGLSTGAGGELAIGSVVRVGRFDIADGDVAAHSNDPAYLDVHFTAFGTAKIGDAFGIPGHFEKLLSNANSDALGFAHQQIAIWVLRAADNATATTTATEHGVFYSTAGNWLFPANGDIPNTTSIDLTDLTNAAGTALNGSARVVIGAFPRGTSSATNAPNFGLAPILRGIPTCTTKPATDITPTTAKLHAAVDAMGRATTVTFTSGGSVLGTVSAGSAQGKVDVSLSLTGLAPETTFTVQAKATNAAGSAKGGAVSFTTPNAPRTNGVTFDPLARVGGGVPNEVGSTIVSFGIPSIRGPGWLAKVATGSASDRAIFSGDPAVRRVTVGSPAADLSTLRYASIDDPVFADDTHFAFGARLSGTGVNATNERAIFSNAFGSLRLLARANAPVEDIPGAKFESFSSLAIPSTQGAVFLAKLKQGPGGVDKTNNVALFVERSGGATLLLRKGGSISAGGQPRTIQTLRVLIAPAGSPGHPRYDATTGAFYGAITFADTTEALITLDNTGAPLVGLATGDSTPTGVKVLTFGQPDLLGGQLVFLGSVEPSGAGAPVTAVVGSDGGIVARVGGTAPNSGGGQFKSFKDPIAATIGATQRLAFRAKLKAAPGVNDANDEGIWEQTGPSGAGLALVAREKGIAPEAGGAKWARLQSLAYLPERGPIFTATLIVGTGKVTAATAAGLWGADGSGTLRCLLRTGDQLTVGGTPRIVSGFSILGTVPRTPAQGRAVAVGKALARVNFADGTTALIAISIQ